MPDAYSRLESLVGRSGVNRLGSAKIAVFGVGGVGSSVVEALARCGVGCLTLVDHGTVGITCINRQLTALHSTLGKSRVQAAKERVWDIDSDILVNTYETFYGKDTAGMFDLRFFDYVVDTMNTVSSKVLLIEKAVECKTPVISCMDTENRLDPSRLEITDLSRTSGDPMAGEIRRELRKQGIRNVPVLSSREKRKTGEPDKESPHSGGSVSFVSGTAGFLIAGRVVRELLSGEKKEEKKSRGKPPRGLQKQKV